MTSLERTIRMNTVMVALSRLPLGMWSMLRQLPKTSNQKRSGNKKKPACDPNERTHTGLIGGDTS
jgi:hypothetical protein